MYPWNVVFLLDFNKIPTAQSTHCKSDGGKIETCFTKLVSNTGKIYFFICYLSIQIVYWVGFYPIGWDSQMYLLLAGIASILVDNGKGLFLWGDEFNLFCRLQC